MESAGTETVLPVYFNILSAPGLLEQSEAPDKTHSLIAMITFSFYQTDEPVLHEFLIYYK